MFYFYADTIELFPIFFLQSCSKFFPECYHMVQFFIYLSKRRVERRCIIFKGKGFLECHLNNLMIFFLSQSDSKYSFK